MTIEDQIKDEKLQYDINKESAKISALSSGKIDKYEYLTGEEILPSNQRQIIEQAKFTYSPLGKAFEKQIKTIEDQGIKQVKAIQDKQIINNNDYKNKLLLSNEREIFKDIYNKRLDKIEEFNNKVDYDNLEYVVVNSGKLYDFSELKGLLTYYEVDRPLPTGKNKKVIGLMKDELGGKIITEFITLRPKAYTYLTDDGKEDKKAKETKKCVIKRMIKFDDCKGCLLNGEVILKSQQRFRSKGNDVYTENINKIALSNNDDKRLIASEKITSYPYGYKGKNMLV